MRVCVCVCVCTTVPPVLQALAAAFAPHLLKPNAWDSRRTVDRARRKQLQHVFVLILFFFIKRKVRISPTISSYCTFLSPHTRQHNIMTGTEREGMDQERKECVSALLLLHSSTSAKLSHAVANLTSQPTMQLIRELASFSSRT